jgi:hypothetical protein
MNPADPETEETLAADPATPTRRAAAGVTDAAPAAEPATPTRRLEAALVVDAPAALPAAATVDDVGAMANVCVVQYVLPCVADTPVSVPALVSVLYCTLMVPADAAACVTSTVCPPNVPIGVRSVLSAMMLMRRQSATVVVRSPTAGEDVEPLALTTDTLKPPSPCTTNATITARSLTLQLAV